MVPQTDVKSPVRRLREGLFHCIAEVGHESRRGLGFNSKQKQFDFFFLMKVLTLKFYSLKKLWHVAQNGVE